MYELVWSVYFSIYRLQLNYNLVRAYLKRFLKHALYFELKIFYFVHDVDWAILGVF